MKTIKLKNFEIANNKPFVLMAGPCQIENMDHCLMLAEKIKKITEKLKINYIFKASFDKANRTSIKSKRGVSLEKGLKTFEQVKKQIDVPVMTDIHLIEQAKPVAEVVDILQIPAFLCRQSDLLEAAAKQNKPIHLKKMQQLAPWVMEDVVKKLEYFGNEQIMLCDRGTMFGYGTLINDMRGLVIMAKTGYPVTIDCTHSVQHPGSAKGVTAGNRDMAQVIASASVAVGIAGVFAEVHEDPDKSPSDAANMIKLDNLEGILKRLSKIDKVAKKYPMKIEQYNIT